MYTINVDAGRGGVSAHGRTTHQEALELACKLMAPGVKVSISDKLGNRISGADLEDCCARRKTLTADLKAN